MACPLRALVVVLMDVVSACPLRVASLVWQARPGTWVLTVVCKATYRLAPDISPLAPEQEDLSEDDNHWDDDPGKSVYAPSDLVPFKTRADVLLVGYAFAPGAARLPSLVARLVVGEVDKAIAVYGDRAWTLDGRIRDLAPLTRVPLRYERAAGGPDSANPVGMRPDAANGLGEIPIPNLWPPGRIPRQRGEIVEPVAFGPIASTWPSRRDKLGPLARSFSVHALSVSALPLDVDPAFFSSAPRDQQLAELHAGERIVLEHLHPIHARVVTNLPGISPCAFVERRNTAPQELSVRADTLWIDTNRQILTMTWRGQFPLASRDEPGRVVVGMAPAGVRLGWSDVAGQLARAAGSHGAGSHGAPSAAEVDEAESLSEDDVRDAGDSMVLPPGGAMRGFAPQVGPAALQTVPVGPQTIPVGPQTIPVGPQTGPGGPQAGPQGASPGGGTEEAASTLFLMGVPDAAQTLPFPFARDGGPTDVLRKAEQAAAEGRAGVLPAGWAPPSPLEGPPPSPPKSPEGPADSPQLPAPPPMIGVRPAFLEALEPLPAAPAPGPVEVAILPALVMAGGSAADAAKMGVAGLSNAAAGAQRAAASKAEADLEAPRAAVEKAPPEPQKPAPGEAFDLVWHAPDLTKKLRRDRGWRRLFLESDLEPPGEDELEVMAEEDAETPEEADRRRIADALARGEPSGIAAVREAVRKGVRGSGRFEAPLLLLEGELEIAFDEVETLRALAAAAAPFGAFDKRVKEAIDAAQEALRSAWIGASGAAADTFSDRIREAFAQMRKDTAASKRPIAADHLDAAASRALATARHYQKRPVYGSPHVRAALRLTGGEEKVPVYLPQEAAERLPLSGRHRARLFAEMGQRMDLGEASRWAGRGLAVGVGVGVG